MNSKIMIATLTVLAAAAMWGLTATQPKQPDDVDRNVHEQYKGGPLVSVSATGRVSSAPDRVSVSIGKTVEADQAAAAVQQVNTTMNELVDQLKDLNLPGAMIQTSSVQLWPNYMPDPKSNVPRINGYRASNILTVRMDDVSRIGEVLDLATRTGANQINGPSFEMKDPDGVQRDALRKAVAEAKKKAQAIADEMGMNIVRWEQINESGTSYPRPMTYGAENMAMRAQTSTSIEAGEIETTATVTLVARLDGEHENEDGD